jgi:nucleoside-diphosphate-sugar epimerase
MSSASQNNVLVLGGNRFIGLRCVELLASRTSYNLFAVNRGGFKQHSRHLLNRVTLLQGSRSDPAVYKGIAGTRGVIVVDFCGYDAGDIRDVAAALAANEVTVGFYLFISTDSVYNVSAGGKEKWGKWREEDARLPASSEERKKMKKKDDYGYDKLKAEVAVAGLRVPSLCLRLADVIGRGDHTHRLFALYLQASSSSKKVCIRGHDRTRLSLTYAPDVARAVLCALKMETDSLSRTGRSAWPSGSALNLVMKENPSLRALVRMLVGAGAKVRFSHSKGGDTFLPSVDCGKIDGSAATEVLSGYRPTALEEALKECREGFVGDIAAQNQNFKEAMELMEK